MASISQKITSLNGGISQQPDELKVPGQVISAKNVLPDLTHGLQKRPGSKLIGSLTDNTDANLNAVTEGRWFSYYRDEAEQYIGQISRTGSIKMWRCSDGQAMTVTYTSAQSAALTSYLVHSEDDDLQTLTLNDFTFINNRTKNTAMSSTVEPAQPNQAFVELKMIKFASQYSLNLFNSTASADLTTISTAIRLKITHNESASADTSTDINTDGSEVKYDLDTDGTCDSVGTELFAVNFNDTDSYDVMYTGDTSTTVANQFNNRGKNLIFRISTTGQPTTTGGSSPSYTCRYSVKCDLLHGGEGWQAGDKIRVRMKSSLAETQYTIEIAEVSVGQVSANLALVRPEPTPFDGETAITADMILGLIRGGITGNNTLSGNGFDIEQIGNGLYIKRTGGAFQADTPVSELLNVITSSVQDVADLPKQCKEGYVVKVKNSSNDEDDYYLKFFANNGLSGDGVWEECAAPNRLIEFDKATMPIQLVRTSLTEFTVSQIDYETCPVGDSITAPKPSFMSTVSGQDGDLSTKNNTINNMVFFRNRLVFLSDENVIMSRPGDFFNFWPKSAIVSGPEDPIDLSCSSKYPAIIYDAIEVNSGLVLFTKNQQFMLTTDSDVLNPSTVKINALASYNFNEKTNPISLGTTVGFLDNANKYSRFFEMSRLLREGEPLVIEQSKVVSQLFARDLKLISNSRENSIIFFSEEDTSTLYGYRYFTSGNERVLQAWFTWTLTGTIRYHCMLDDALFVVVKNGGKDQLLRYSIKLDDEGHYVTDGEDYPIHLDNSFKISTLATYNPTLKETTFTPPIGFLNTTAELAAFDIDDETNLGHYGLITLQSGTNDYLLKGNWSKGVTSTTITTAGYGWNSPPPITLSGGGGVDARGSSTINVFGVLEAVVIDDTGYNYTSAPTITIGNAWQANQAYVVGDQVTNGGQIYTCDTAGTSAASGSGPSGTNPNIVDGSARWDHSGVHSAATATISGEFIIGYNFDMQVELPTLYRTFAAGNSYRSDTRSDLIIHRVKFSFGNIGVYTINIQREGKPDYVEVVEVNKGNSVKTNSLTFLNSSLQTVPCYERNKNLIVKISSKHPSPATMVSYSWEGDYNTKSYSRV